MSEMQEYHNYSGKLQSAVENIRESDEISDGNRELALGMIEWYKLDQDKSDGRIFKYATCLKKTFENIDMDLQELEDNEGWKKKYRKLLLNVKESKYYNGGDWAESTKEDYYKILEDIIEYQSISDRPRQTKLIPTDFSPYRGSNGEKDHTPPENLPVPDEVKKFCRQIEEQGKPVISLRNAAMLLVLWDTGARIGEAAHIRIKDVKVRNGRIWVKIPGNKQSRDREVRIFQGVKTIREWLENGHPVSDFENNPDAYLFPKMWPSVEKYSPVGYNGFKNKVVMKAYKRLKQQGEVSCKLEGEPNHIWRKGMTTYYVINDILTYDKVLMRHGKSVDDPTLPEYLRVMMSDIDASAAEGFGLDEDEEVFEHEVAKSMRDGDLLPKTCTSCGKEVRCYRDSCGSCGSELESQAFPGDDEDDQKAVTSVTAKTLSAITSGEIDGDNPEEIQEFMDQVAEDELG